MSDYKVDPIEQINAQIEEKTSKAEGLGSELQKAKSFIQQVEPEFYSLMGAVRELQELRSKLTGEPVKQTEPKKENNNKKEVTNEALETDRKNG